MPIQPAVYIYIYIETRPQSSIPSIRLELLAVRDHAHDSSSSAMYIVATPHSGILYNFSFNLYSATAGSL